MAWSDIWSSFIVSSLLNVHLTIVLYKLMKIYCWKPKIELAFITAAGWEALFPSTLCETTDNRVFHIYFQNLNKSKYRVCGKSDFPSPFSTQKMVWFFPPSNILDVKNVCSGVKEQNLGLLLSTPRLAPALWSAPCSLENCDNLQSCNM